MLLKLICRMLNTDSRSIKMRAIQIKLLSIILLFCCMAFLKLYGQISIIADPLWGCDSLTVTFGIYPPDSASSITDISWTFTKEGLVVDVVDNEINPVVSFNAPGFYSVSCLINNSITVSKNDLICIYEGPCESFIQVPNVFSPNGDGINDYFKVLTNGLNVFSLSVYTKSGVLVYRAESPELEWDGRTMSGQELSAGIYYYVVKQVDGDANIEKTGFVHLLR